jgi:hypothetical protein
MQRKKQEQDTILQRQLCACTTEMSRAYINVKNNLGAVVLACWTDRRLSIRGIVVLAGKEIHDPLFQRRCFHGLSVA